MESTNNIIPTQVVLTIDGSYPSNDVAANQQQQQQHRQHHHLFNHIHQGGGGDMSWRLPLSKFLPGKIDPLEGTKRSVRHFYEKQRELVESYERSEKRRAKMERRALETLKTPASSSTEQEQTTQELTQHHSPEKKQQQQENLTIAVKMMDASTGGTGSSISSPRRYQYAPRLPESEMDMDNDNDADQNGEEEEEEDEENAVDTSSVEGGGGGGSTTGGTTKKRRSTTKSSSAAAVPTTTSSTLATSSVGTAASTTTASAISTVGGKVAAVDDDAAGICASSSSSHDKLAASIAFAINLSFAANLLLFAVKIFAAIYSGSLAVIASAVDSSLDIVSGTIIYAAAKIAAKKNPHLYPVGKAKLEPLAIIVFASVMGVASLQLMVTSIQDIVAGYMQSPPTIVIDEITYGVLAAVIITKAILYFVCSRLADKSASLDALAQDHRNDVVTNAVTIASVLLAVNFTAAWVLDPLCAFLLATIIVTNWAQTGREYIQQMTGRVAEPQVLSQLTFAAMNFHPAIRAIDTVRAYHSGSKLLVEVDIVLAPDMPLLQAHDIGEGLQHLLESQESVERAFVHMDTESDHKAEDEHTYPW